MKNNKMVNMQIKSHNIFLRGIHENDLNDLFEYGSNPQVTHFLSWKKYANLHQAYQALHEILLKSVLPLWAIEFIPLKKMIGTIAVVKQEQNRLYIGYVLHQKFHNQGIMSKVVKICCDWITENYPKHDIYAEVIVQNKASLSVLQKNQFKIIKNIKINHHGQKYEGLLLKKH